MRSKYNWVITRDKTRKNVRGRKIRREKIYVSLKAHGVKEKNRGEFVAARGNVDRFRYSVQIKPATSDLQFPLLRFEQFFYS